MSYFPRAGHASSPASVRSLELGAGTALSSWPRCPDPLASAASLSTHSSVCLGLPGASGTQTHSQPPGALVQAATPGGLAGLTASPADKGRRQAPGVAGRARRPSEGWAVHVGLGPGLRGKGRAAGRGRGGGRSTQPGSRGAKGCVPVLPAEHSCAGGVDTWDRRASLEAPSHGGGRLRSGGTSQVSPPAPGRAHTALEADRWGQAPGRLSCEAWPLVPCVPTTGPAWPRPGGC